MRNEGNTTYHVQLPVSTKRKLEKLARDSGKPMRQIVIELVEAAK